MLRLLNRKRLAYLTLTAIFTTLLLVVTFGDSIQPAAMLAHRLEVAIPSVPDVQVPDHLQLLIELGRGGSDVLVRALGSSRKIVAESAGTALHHQLDLWERLPPEESTLLVVHLSEQLADHCPRWQPHSQSVAADLAARLLRWPLRRKSDASARIVAACHRIWEMSPVSISLARSAGPGSMSVPGRALATGGEPTLATPAGVLNLRIDALPGGGLPTEEQELEPPPLPPARGFQVEQQPSVRQEPDLLSLPAQEQPRLLFPQQPASDPNPREADSPTPPADPPAVHRRGTTTGLASPATALAGHAESAPSELALLQKLRHANVSERRLIEEQLRHRGFDQSQITLAHRLADPDPWVRQQLVESLSSVDASPRKWLYWLSFDPDPLVRQRTVPLMATSQDPLLHRRLREMERLETDEGVLEVLNRACPRQRRR